LYSDQTQLLTIAAKFALAMHIRSPLYALLFISPALAIWPRPQNLTTGQIALRLASDFSIKFSGINQVPQDLSDAAQRTADFLKTDKLQALVPDRGASSAGTIQSARTLSSLTATLAGSSGAVKSISEDATAGLGIADESYALQIPENGGTATLTANTALGLLRGFTSFGQLWYDLDGTTYTLEAPIQIKDASAYVSILFHGRSLDYIDPIRRIALQRVHAGYLPELVGFNLVESTHIYSPLGQLPCRRYQTYFGCNELGQDQPFPLACRRLSVLPPRRPRI
jgi:hypothetical protein